MVRYSGFLPESKLRRPPAQFVDWRREQHVNVLRDFFGTFRAEACVSMLSGAICSRRNDAELSAAIVAYLIEPAMKNGGRGGIRTHGGLAPTAVFKTAALNHSATLPCRAALDRADACGAPAWGWHRRGAGRSPGAGRRRARPGRRWCRWKTCLSTPRVIAGEPCPTRRLLVKRSGHATTGQQGARRHSTRRNTMPPWCSVSASTKAPSAVKPVSSQ